MTSNKRGGTILILFGVMVALVTALIVFSLSKQASAATQVEMTDVVVATRDVPERTVIPAEALGTKRIPADAAPQGVVTMIGQAAGKMATVHLYQGEMLLAVKLADTKGQSGLAYALDKGKVLMTFPASDIVTTGALRIGDTVDILVTIKTPVQAGPAAAPAVREGEALPVTTQTTMQNLKIVSIGTAATQASKTTSGTSPNAGSNLITFALDHQDALLLKALKDGDGMNLEVVLRAAGDDEIVMTQPVTMRTIIERYRLRAQ